MLRVGDRRPRPGEVPRVLPGPGLATAVMGGGRWPEAGASCSGVQLARSCEGKPCMQGHAGIK